MKVIKFNKTIIATMLLLFMTIAACDEDILDQANPNAPSPATFWRDAEDAKKGIMGAYAAFTDIWYYTRFEIFLSDYRDDVVNGYKASERTAAGNFNGLPESNGAFWVWSAMYKGISRTNEVLANVPDIDMDAEVKKNILGEAYFIRGLNYFNLLNNWQNVPLITVPSGQIEDTRNVPQATPEETFNQIVKDLEEAEKMLPKKWGTADLGRATSGGAAGLLGKVYLYNKNYSEATTQFLKVMASDSGYGLMDDYRDNFLEETENNKESVFEIQLISDGLNGWCADCASHGAGAGYMQDLAPQGFTGQDGFRVNDWALDLFLDEQTVNDEIDPRAFVTFFWNNSDSTSYQGDYLKSQTYADRNWEDVYGLEDTRIFASKHLNASKYEEASGWHTSGNNIRLIRYADILLMFAEAEFELNGSSPAAVKAVNDVRARVDMPTFTTITMQDIIDERVKELTFEKTRYFDLLRWGQVKAKIVDTPNIKSESGGTGSYVPGREYVAIPTNEMNNSDVFVQNQGYAF